MPKSSLCQEISVSAFTLILIQWCHQSSSQVSNIYQCHPTTGRHPVFFRLNECWIRGSVFLLSPSDQPLFKKEMQETMYFYIVLFWRLKSGKQECWKSRTKINSALLTPWFSLCVLGYKGSKHIKLIPSVKSLFCNPQLHHSYACI